MPPPFKIQLRESFDRFTREGPNYCITTSCIHICVEYAWTAYRVENGSRAHLLRVHTFTHLIYLTVFDEQVGLFKSLKI